SVPILNETLMDNEPESDSVEVMYNMSSTPLMACSSGAATAVATSSALAPGYTALTRTFGGVTVGNCCTGRPNMAITPARTMTIAITAAKIGRSIKNLE